MTAPKYTRPDRLHALYELALRRTETALLRFEAGFAPAAPDDGPGRRGGAVTGPQAQLAPQRGGRADHVALEWRKTFLGQQGRTRRSLRRPGFT